MIHFDRKCVPANDIVVLRVVERDLLATKKGSFVVGDDTFRDLRVGFYRVEAIGSEARERTGLDVGSYVFADKLASFYHTEPVCMMRWNAIIMETNADKTKYRALAGRAIVQPVKMEQNQAAAVGGFVVPSSDELRIGEIKSITPPFKSDDSMEVDEIPFKVGDRVLLTKEQKDELHGFCGDGSLDPTVPILLYKTKDIVCKVV